MTRVVDITQWYSPTSGGIRTYLHAKAAWAARVGMGHAAVLTGPADGYATLGGSPVVVVRGRTPTDRWGYRPALHPRGFLDAMDLLRPEVVVVHDATAFPHAIAEWARDRRVPLVHLCHSHLGGAAGGLPRVLRGPVRGALGVVQRRALRVGEVVLVASETTRRSIRRGLTAPVVVSPLGVDLDVFTAAAPDPALRARLAPAGEPLVLFAGRLSSEKRVDFLIPMLRALPEVRLLVAGDGAQRTRLARDARRADVAHRVEFLGHVADRVELARLMATVDCAVHTNPDEPFGLAPLEAIAAGTRVVAPDSGGPSETLAGRGATLVAPCSAAALARGVREALSGPRPNADLSDLGWDRVFAREWAVYEHVRQGVAA